MPAPRWMNQATSQEFSWSQALGGTRGVIETSAPGLVFVIVYVATHALVPTLVAASAVALIACIIRLIQRQSVAQALSGLLGVAKLALGLPLFALGAWATWWGLRDYSSSSSDSSADADATVSRS